mgnify:CR=1 FL=1
MRPLLLLAAAVGLLWLLRRRIVVIVPDEFAEPAWDTYQAALLRREP